MLESLFNKVAGPAASLKKRLWHWCFPVYFSKFSRTPFRDTASEYLKHVIVSNITARKLKLPLIKSMVSMNTSANICVFVHIC